MKKLIVILFPFVAFSQIDNATIQLEFIKLLNQYRIQHGIKPVTINLDAQKAAKIQSDYIASTFQVDKDKLNYQCGHSHPIYNSPTDRLKVVNPVLEESLSVAENAAVFFNVTLLSKDIAQHVFEQWKSSPTHNAIMLNPKCSQIGIFISLNTKIVINTYGNFKYDTKYNMFAATLVLLHPIEFTFD